VSLFNGSVSVYVDHLLKGRSEVSQEAIKTVKSLPAITENDHYVLSGGLSEKIYVHKTNLTEEVDFSFTTIAEC
jgi:hypothetical protein